MPFDPASITTPFRMQPGLRRLAPGSPQLTPLHADSPVLTAKLAVLQAHADQALCAVPGFDAAPAWQALLDQAHRDAPQAWRQCPGERLEATTLGWAIDGEQVEGHGDPAIGRCLRALPAAWRPAALLSLAFHEDLAVIEAADTRIPWLAVCLPSHWAPLAKLGRPFAEVHAPVADNGLLLKAAESLARLVSGPQRWERFVWNLTPSAAFDAHPQRQPAHPWPTADSAQAVAEAAWLRTEHQTFIPLPDHQQSVFTIQVELQRLTALPTRCAPALRDALSTMSPAVLDYRGLTQARDPLLDWLTHASATGTA